MLDECLLKNVSGIGANHDKFTMCHINDFHLAKSNGKTECNKQKDGPEADSVEQLHNDYRHFLPSFVEILSLMIGTAAT
jgi:hypothetical protein